MNEELGLNKLESTIVFKERYMNQEEIIREFDKIKEKLDRLLKMFEKAST